MQFQTRANPRFNNFGSQFDQGKSTRLEHGQQGWLQRGRPLSWDMTNKHLQLLGNNYWKCQCHHKCHHPHRLHRHLSIHHKCWSLCSILGDRCACNECWGGRKSSLLYLPNNLDNSGDTKRHENSSRQSLTSELKQFGNPCKCSCL